MMFRKVRIALRRIYYPFIYRWMPIKKLESSSAEKCGIVVSLTTYSKRIDKIDICIRSLLRQTMSPKTVVLYLGKDVTDDMIPHKLLKLQNYGLIIKKGYENIKPHKKYFYSMQEYPDDIIITVDDDAIYDRYLVESLYNKHYQFPKAIIARTVRKITTDENGLMLYRNWEFVSNTLDQEPSMSLMAVGVGGVLYPPHCMLDRCFDIEIIKNVALDTDDLWLKFMEILSSTPVANCKSDYFMPIAIERHQKVGLFVNNVLRDQNDENIDQLQKKLGVELKAYAENKSR